MAGPTLITVFTATYNRAQTLHRVFDSLRVQTFRDFEWLVVDDGSIDETERLVAGWARIADFPVRYLRQDHAGKHFAHNRMLREARGRFMVVLDSDDAFVPDALEKLMGAWETIPENERHSFFSVGGICRDQNGNVVGDKVPTEPFDADLREMIYVHQIRGERVILALTEIMRRYPFPEVHGTYLPEGMVWLDVAKKFKTRWTNDVVRVYYVNDPATGTTVTQRGSRGHHALGRWHYYIWLFNNDLEYFRHAPLAFIKAAAMLPVVGWLSGQTLKGTFAGLNSRAAQLLVLSALPFSALLYIAERARAVVRPPA